MAGLTDCERFDGLPIPIIAVDASFVIAYTNSEAARCLGATRAALVGHALRIEPGNRVRAVDGATVIVEFAEAGPTAFSVGGSPLWVGVLRQCGERDLESGSTLGERIRAVVASATSIEEFSEPSTWLAAVSGVMAREFDSALVGFWLREPMLEEPIRLVAEARTTRGAVTANDSGPISSDRLRDFLEPGGDEAREWGVAELADRAGLPSSWLLAEEVAALSVLPLAAGGTTQGYLTTLSRLPVTADLRATLETVARVVAVGLSNFGLQDVARRARLQVDRQHERLRTVLDVLPVAVMVLDRPNGHVSLLNALARNLGRGRPSAEELGSFSELHLRFPVYHLDGRPYQEQERPLWRTLHRGESIREIVKTIGPKGEERLYEVATAPIPEPEGGAVTAYRDVTEEHRLKFELADRAAQLKSLLDNIPVGVAYFDRTGLCRASNGPARDLLGRAGATLAGEEAAALFRHAPALREALTRCVREATPHVETSSPWPDPDGGERGVRYLDWRFQPLPAATRSSPGVLALIVDVTDRKLAADQLQRAAAEALQVSRHKTQFLSAVSHDLRTPVNALGLQAEWLATIAARQHDADPELAPLAADIQTSTANLAELINDLLDLTLFDAGALEYQATEFLLDEWLEATLASLRTQARAKGLRMTWNVDRPRRTIRADRVKLGRVLVNLAGNAVKFTEQGFVEVRAGKSADGEFEVSVRDSGPGIPADQQERIFDEFAQLRNPERDRTRGTGLGLAISRRLIHSAGGRLVVESEPGRGSTFRAFYPADQLVDSPDPPPATTTDEAHAEGPSIPHASIMLVEDDPFSRRSLGKLLEREGFEVEAVEDGTLALESLKSRKPDLVLLDLMLPGLDGGEVLRRIRRFADRDALPVIVLTGDVLSGRSSELRAMDVNGIIGKPVDLGELLELIRACLESHTQR